VRHQVVLLECGDKVRTDGDPGGHLDSIVLPVASLFVVMLVALAVSAFARAAAAAVASPPFRYQLLMCARARTRFRDLRMASHEKFNMDGCNVE
jgi:hypothetical protein